MNSTSTMVATATATELQNNFGKYLKIVMDGGEVIVTRNGKEVGRFVPKDTVASFLTDSLTGILNRNDDWKDEKEEILREAYEITD